MKSGPSVKEISTSEPVLATITQLDTLGNTSSVMSLRSLQIMDTDSGLLILVMDPSIKEKVLDYHSIRVEKKEM
jgi:hypothetical protein